MSIHTPSIRQSILAAALLSILAPAFAQDTSNLDSVVVTATRTAQTQDQTLAAVTVIDRADIERLQPASLQDLLSTTPSLAIANTGGPGKISSIFLRGTEADQVLILVDGIKIGSATTGTAAIQDIPIDQIERIEIVRGPFSSLYGSEAVGGVIQIFTRHAAGSFTPNLSMGFGSYAHWNTAAGFSGQTTNGWYSMQVSHDQVHGFPACRMGAAEAGAGCFVDDPNPDGYRNTSFTLQGGYRFDQDWDADFRAFRAQGYNQYAGSFSDSDDSVTQVLGGRVRFQAAKNVKLTLSVGGSADLDEDYLHGVYVDNFNTHRTIGSLQADIGISSGLLSTGVDWQRDTVSSNTDFAVDSRTDRGVFAQWQQSFGSQSLQANVRHDDDTQFDGKTTGSLMWGWNFASNLRLTASYGTAFRAPTFNELYYPGYGNPDLKPETSRNFEIGLRGTYNWGDWSVNAFRNNVNNMITYDAAIGLPANVDRARITGVEGTVGTKIADWSLKATATMMNPTDEATGYYAGNQLPRRPKRSARFDADRSFGKFSLGGSWSVASRRYDDLANQDPLGGYALTSLRAAYALSSDWKLQLALNNVFAKNYETAWYYNQPGRNYMLTLRYQPAQ